MMTKENILKKLYDIKKGTTDVNQLINAIEHDLLEKPVRRLKKDRIVGIKHIREIGRKNGISPTWLQGFEIDGKTVITNGYTMAMLNENPLGGKCDNEDKLATLKKLICGVRLCNTFEDVSAVASYQELHNFYTVEKARGNKRPMYYIDECERRWNVQYLLDAMRLFKNPVFYGYNPEKTYVVIAEDGDAELDEFVIVLGTTGTIRY